MQTIEKYFVQRRIYQVEFFAFKSYALKWLLSKPLIIIGYVLHTVRCYIQKRDFDLFLWIFQTFYLILFLVSIGFERFGVGLFICACIYTAEFLVGISKVPAFSNVHRWVIYAVFAVFILQKSPALLWKKSETIPLLALPNCGNRIIHTPEISLVPLLLECSYQLPLYPPARFKGPNYSEVYVQEVQNQYLQADILILGEYAFTEYPDVYDRNKISIYFERYLHQEKYEVWVKKATENVCIVKNNFSS